MSSDSETIKTLPENPIRMDELTKKLNSIPTNSTEDDVNNICLYLKSGFFEVAFPFAKKVSLNFCKPATKYHLLSMLFEIVPTSNAAIELYHHFLAFIDREELIKTFAGSPFISDILLPFLMKSSEIVYDLINAFGLFNPIPSHLQTVRQGAFQFAFLRKERQICFDLIKSVTLKRASSDFAEFSAYCTSFIQLIVDDEPIAREFFKFLMNISALFKGTQMSWFISLTTSFAPLLYGKTVHTSVLNYVNFISKPIRLVKSFEEATKPIYDHDLPLSASPPLLRPYYLYNLWHIDINNLNSSSTNSAEDVYNVILELCDTNQNVNLIIDFLAKLPIGNSLPFYYLLAKKGNQYEHSFNEAVSLAFKEKLTDKIIPIFERAARSLPVLLKPHFDSISTLEIPTCATIIAFLIKADMISFAKLWSHLKSYKLSEVKQIVLEGIIQIQRRSRSFENSRFISDVLLNFFRDPTNNINWSAVAKEFPTNQNIASTILLNTNNNSIKSGLNINNSNNGTASKGSGPLLQWREQFMKYVARSPANYHRVMAVPFLLLSAGDNNLPAESVKWAVSKLPVYQCKAEAVIEGYAIFELSKHILSQHTSSEEAFEIMHDLFGFEKKCVTSYAAAFAHAAVVHAVGSQDSVVALMSSFASSHLMIARSSKLAINFLRQSGFNFAENYTKTVEELRNPLSDKIVNLLSISINYPKNNNSNNNNNENNSLKENSIDGINAEYSIEDKNFLEMLIKAHSMTVEQITTELNQKNFSNFETVRNHFLLLSISCFLLLPARSVPQSAVEKCFSLLTSPASNSEQKCFALNALSQIPSITVPQDLKQSLLLAGQQQQKEQPNDSPEILVSLCQLAVRQNDIQMITAILEKSDNFAIVAVLKPLIPYIDQKLLSDYVERATFKTDPAVLLNSVDMFMNLSIIHIILTYIRTNPILDIISKNQYHKLRTALAKFCQADLEKYIFSPFDDLALLSAFEYGLSVSAICRKLLSEKCRVTIPVLFLVALKAKEKMLDFAESMFAIISKLESNDVIKASRYISLFYLVKSKNEPFVSLILHFQANPSELSEQILEQLIPSLFSINVFKCEHLDILQNALSEKKDSFLIEAIDALKLCNLQ